jgi:transcriptional regulator with XRE-family HTH domain
MKLFPSNLKNLRLNHNMSQEELGKQINVTKVSISGYESGNRTPDVETLIAIADVFNVSLDSLCGRNVEHSEHAAHTLGQRIKHLRELNGHSQIQLGEILGIGNHNLSRYESGQREPELETLCKIADVYGVTTDYLLGRKDETITFNPETDKALEIYSYLKEKFK